MRLAFTIVGFIVLACSPTVSPSPTNPGLPRVLSLENRGGPTLVVNINGSEAATIKCGGGTTLTPGGGLPQLPWSLSIVRQADATPVFAGEITDLPQWYLQIGETSMGLGSSPPIGPATTCPPPGLATPTVFPEATELLPLIPACLRQAGDAAVGVVDQRPEGWYDQGEAPAPSDFPDIRTRVYGPQGLTTPPFEGPSRIVLYETFPASDAYFESRIALSRKNGGEAVAVTVCGEATEAWLDESTGELVIGWTDRNKSDVLVANTADFTVQQLVDSAERVYDCCG